MSTVRKKSGVSDHQAETLVEMIKEATDSSIEHLATGEELLLTKAELKQDVVSVREELLLTKAELKGDIASIREELLLTKAELKGDIASVKTELAELKGSMNMQTKVLFGFCLVVVVNILFFWLHH